MECRRSIGPHQQFCTGCGAAVVTVASGETTAQLPSHTELVEHPSHIPRWAWATVVAVVAIALIGAGAFAGSKLSEPNGSNPSAAGTSPSAVPSAPAANSSPANPPSTTLEIPVGWTLWKLDGGAFAVRRLGDTVSIGHFGEPCFTGEAVGAQKYQGGGITQQGTYQNATWTVKMIDPSRILIATTDYEARGELVNGDRVPTAWGGITLSELQQGC